MNKLVFICLLSVSLCYSSPTSTKVAEKTPQTATVEQKSTLPVNPAATIPSDSSTHLETSTKSESTTTQLQPVTAPNVTLTSAPKTDNATTGIASNATSNATPIQDKTKKEDKQEKTTESTTKPAVTTSVNPMKEDEKATTKPASVTTPKELTTEKPTAAPHSDDTHKAATVQSRGFDGASFVGGMILTMGLLAIGFIGFKYYKNHAERNYHTL